MADKIDYLTDIKKRKSNMIEDGERSDDKEELVDSDEYEAEGDFEEEPETEEEFDEKESEAEEEFEEEEPEAEEEFDEEDSEADEESDEEESEAEEESEEEESDSEDDESEFDEESSDEFLDSADETDESAEESEEEFTEDDFEDSEKEQASEADPEKEEPQRRKLAPIIFLSVVAFICIFALWMVKTSSGRRFGYSIIAKFVRGNVSTVDKDKTDGSDRIQAGEQEVVVVVPSEDDEEAIKPERDPNYVENTVVAKEHRSEEYVKTFLIFGIENINGGTNTDAIMLISVNTKDNTIKMTSILRDTYVAIPGFYNNKINSAYAGVYWSDEDKKTIAERKDAASRTLMQTIENTFDIKIDGYASVNFDGFENIIDTLGGIDIELGEKEAKYLNKTNYISKPSNRNVSAGWNRLNGNQALGYVRVRKVATLGGANNDYGRTLRQRRVLNAIIAKCKNLKITELLSIMQKCLGQVFTNITEDQITDILYDVVEKRIFTTKSMRLPADNLFEDSGKTGVNNGKHVITYALLMDGHEEENIKKLHEFIFLDEAE